MEVEESERVVIAKPVASRPNCSRFKSFSKLLAGVIDSPCSTSFSEPIIAAIRPKTVRFRPAASQAEVPRTMTCDPASEDLKPRGETTVIYKPKAKLALRSPISLSVNEGSFHTSRRPALSPRVEDLVPRSETDEDVRSLNLASNVDGTSYDGYNWRKYGQKQVKGSEYPRSYYKCTHPNCPMKKKVERSFDGQIAEIVYKGEHSHAKPRVPKRGGSSGSHQGLGIVPDDLAGRSSTDEGKECRLENRNAIRSSSLSTYHGKGQLGCEPDSSCGPSGGVDGRTRGAEMEDEGPRNKRRKIESQSSEAGISGEGIQQDGHVVVQRSSSTDPLGDGFRWRKYGQKVVKGSPYPRSYYRCTSLKCNVRKHVERASDDPTSFVTTYEGKHNHEIPARSTNPTSDHR